VTATKGETVKLPKQAQAVVKQYDHKLCKHLIELVNKQLQDTGSVDGTSAILFFIEQKGWWYGYENDRYFLAENKDDRLRRKMREEAQQTGVEN
tara:strand:+ start:947 stop:1228 length:282 start_codon:yes stop_codon:yes gene_type:complete